MRNLLAVLLLGAAVAPSIPWGDLGNLIPVPQPAPVPAPVPGPTPPPTPGTTLAKLVPDIQQRTRLVRFFDDLATLLERDTDGRIADMEKLRSANLAAGALLEKSGAVAPNPAFWAEVDRRYTERLGLEPLAIDAAKRAQIVTFYRGLAVEVAQ